jgi:hypothetical protein
MQGAMYACCQGFELLFCLLLLVVSALPATALL